MATHYEHGRAAEYACMRELAAEGWSVARMAGSHGAFDVIAWSADRTRFIQLKTFIDRCPSFKEDITKMTDTVLPHCGVAELWVKQFGKKGWHMKKTFNPTLVPHG